MTDDTEWRRGTITQHHDFGRNGQSAGVFDGAYRYPVMPGRHGSMPAIGTDVFFKMVDGWAVLSDTERGGPDTSDEAGDPISPADRTPSGAYYEHDMEGGKIEHAGEHDQPMGHGWHGSGRSEMDATSGAGLGEIQARPLRIQDVIRDAHPQPWKIQRGGGFLAEPEPEHGVWLEAQPNDDGGWWWRVVSPQLSARGDARSPGEAVAAAEAVYWVSFRNTC